MKMVLGNLTRKENQDIQLVCKDFYTGQVPAATEPVALMPEQERQHLSERLAFFLRHVPNSNKRKDYHGHEVTLGPEIPEAVTAENLDVVLKLADAKRDSIMDDRASEIGAESGSQVYEYKKYYETEDYYAPLVAALADKELIEQLKKYLQMFGP